MQYTGNIIRPPSEADSIILQVTVGCSHNKCTFCGVYKEVDFALKSQEQLEEDLEFAAQHCVNQKRLFLADGDALILPQKKLLHLLSRIRHTLPWIRRVSLYANARAVRSKSPAQLAELKAHGLDRVYFGLESGDDEVLQAVQKGESATSMIEAGIKVRKAGLFLSVTALLGLAGIAGSTRHATETGRVLQMIQPNQIAVLTLIPLPNTLLGKLVESGQFVLPQPKEMLQELRLILQQLSGIRCQFHANHASTYLPLAGRLPKDRSRLLETVEMALSGKIATVEEYRRAL